MGKKKFILTIIILLVAIVFGAILLLNIQNNYKSDSVNNSNQQKIQTHVTPGPTGTTCLETADCAGACGDDPCFISSCAKNYSSDSGTCVCLQICEE